MEMSKWVTFVWSEANVKHRSSQEIVLNIKQKMKAIDYGPEAQTNIYEIIPIMKK